MTNDRAGNLYSDDFDDDWAEPSLACRLSLHERCLEGKCACDCHDEANAAMRDAMAQERNRD